MSLQICDKKVAQVSVNICIYIVNLKSQTLNEIIYKIEKLGPTEILTRITGFGVQSANHYSIDPSTNRIGRIWPNEMYI